MLPKDITEPDMRKARRQEGCHRFFAWSDTVYTGKM